MPILEIITIGTELLLGEIADTNSTYIARTLRDHGIDIFRITTIGDNPGRITSTIQEALNRSDIIITTGGLGPTVDDPTRQAVADAVHRDLVFSPELWDQIKEKFKDYGRTPTDNNRRQAYIPDGALPIHNPVGTAPCFVVDIDDACIISLPGVPSEMKFILHDAIIPYLSKKFVLKSQIIKATVLHTASIGESVIDEMIADLEELSNPTVGLLSHPGQVDIRVTAKADSTTQAIELSKPIISEIFNRLGENIYGQDGKTLEGIVSDLLNRQDLKFNLVTHGLKGTFASRLELGQPNNLTIKHLADTPEDMRTFQRQLAQLTEDDSEITFGVALLLNEKITLHLIFNHPENRARQTKMYGGPRDYALLWAQNTGLDFLRRELMKVTGK